MILLQPDKENIEEYLQLARTYGCGFELMDLAFAQNLDDRNKIEELHRMYQGAPLHSCHGVFADLNYSGSDPLIYEASVRRIRQCIETGLSFGISKFVFHSCFHPVLPPDNPLYHIWDKTASVLFHSLVEEYDVEIYLENVLDPGPAILKNMVEEAQDPRIRVCLDIGHAHFSGSTMEEWFEELHPYIGYIHLSDNHGRYDEHLAPGEGSVDWDLFGKLVKQYHIEADYTLEVTGIERVRQSLSYMEQG